MENQTEKSDDAFIQIGDIVVGGKCELNDIRDTALNLLKNKSVKKYLRQDYAKRKISGMIG